MCKYFQLQMNHVINLSSLKLNKFIDYSFTSQIPSHIICNYAHLSPSKEETNVPNVCIVFFCAKKCKLWSIMLFKLHHELNEGFHFLTYFSLELFVKVFYLHKTFFEFLDDFCYHTLIKNDIFAINPCN